MKSILVVYNEIPYHLSHGGNIRVFYLLKELSRYYDVTLLALLNKRGYPIPVALKKLCNVIIAPCFVEDFLRNKGFLRYFTKAMYFKLERAFPLFKSKLLINYNYQRFCLNKALKKILNHKKFDYIQVEHSYLGYALNNINTNAIKILDFHNVHSYMKNNPKELKLIRKYEKELANKFDVAICCSQADKKRLENLGYKKILIVQNGVDTEYFREVPYSKPSSLLFVGDLTYLPNREGIKYFLKEIYSLLPLNIKVNIIGKYNLKDFKNERTLKNVKFFGYVRDIRHYFKNSVFICPLLNGGGTRLKILTAFSSGVPVVSTRKGAEGIDYKDKRDIYIADTPQVFAKIIKDIFNNPKNSYIIRRNARKLAESKYEWGKIVKKYNQELEGVK